MKQSEIQFQPGYGITILFTTIDSLLCSNAFISIITLEKQLCIQKILNFMQMWVLLFTVLVKIEKKNYFDITEIAVLVGNNIICNNTSGWTNIVMLWSRLYM